MKYTIIIAILLAMSNCCTLVLLHRANTQLQTQRTLTENAYRVIRIAANRQETAQRPKTSRLSRLRALYSAPEQTPLYVTEPEIWPESEHGQRICTGNSHDTQQPDNPVLEPDAYGLDVHKNRFGQAVMVRPDFGSVPGETLIIKQDAYGLGVHSDQYGRPVREYPLH